MTDQISEIKNPIEFVMEVFDDDESDNKNSEIRRSGTEALVKALGLIGMAGYLEEYDNGGVESSTA